ncbi:MAG: hypothetical protein ACI8S3_000247 [Alphaproteobacteria bacterium]|jgi:hypothetical protein
MEMPFFRGFEGREAAFAAQKRLTPLQKAPHPDAAVAFITRRIGDTNPIRLRLYHLCHKIGYSMIRATKIVKSNALLCYF